MENIISQYEKSFRINWKEKALSDFFTDETKTYAELAAEIKKIHFFYERLGLKKGDKVALSGRNTPNWVTVYIATVTYGAVIVPVLADFNPADMANIIRHSDARLLFIDEMLWKKLDSSSLESGLEAVIDLENGTIIKDNEKEAASGARLLSVEDFKNSFPEGFKWSDIKYEAPDPDDLMIINYTSGTSGFSKGVMLTVRNITANVSFAIDHKFHFNGSRVLALLPLAHAYGCAFDMLTPLAAGSHITLLGKMPTPAILISAMQKVRPHLICTVPLVLEKIVKKKVLPELEKNPVKTLISIPVIRNFVYAGIRKKMLESFGGCVKEVNTGGAALSSEVETFLMKIKFPFTVGYGMTECAPLIAYEGHEKYKAGSCGRILPGMSVRIDRPDGSKEAGEILVRGRNVMKGYYKNEEATAAAIDNDGWLHTGDMGVTDPDGTIYIKGRCKSMILSGNGQNIYPEEIEFKLNEMPYVAESLVYQEKGRLIALIVPDDAALKKDGKSEEDITVIMNDNIVKLNSLVAAYEQIAEFKLCENEFEKTPKRSIKRYLYPMQAILRDLPATRDVVIRGLRRPKAPRE